MPTDARTRTQAHLVGIWSSTSWNASKLMIIELVPFLNRCKQLIHLGSGVAATNDQDINDIFGKGGSHTAPNTIQTGAPQTGGGQRSGQGSGAQHSSQGSAGQSNGSGRGGAQAAPATGSTGTSSGQKGVQLHRPRAVLHSLRFCALC